jgi:hypothetical protein
VVEGFENMMVWDAKIEPFVVPIKIYFQNFGCPLIGF